MSNEQISIAALVGPIALSYVFGTAIYGLAWAGAVLRRWRTGAELASRREWTRAALAVAFLLIVALDDFAFRALLDGAIYTITDLQFSWAPVGAAVVAFAVGWPVALWARSRPRRAVLLLAVFFATANVAAMLRLLLAHGVALLQWDAVGPLGGYLVWPVLVIEYGIGAGLAGWYAAGNVSSVRGLAVTLLGGIFAAFHVQTVSAGYESTDAVSNSLMQTGMLFSGLLWASIFWFYLGVIRFPLIHWTRSSQGQGSVPDAVRALRDAFS